MTPYRRLARACVAQRCWAGGTWACGIGNPGSLPLPLPCRLPPVTNSSANSPAGAAPCPRPWFQLPNSPVATRSLSLRRRRARLQLERRKWPAAATRGSSWGWGTPSSTSPLSSTRASSPSTRFLPDHFSPRLTISQLRLLIVLSFSM